MSPRSTALNGQSGSTARNRGRDAANAATGDAEGGAERQDSAASTRGRGRARPVATAATQVAPHVESSQTMASG